MADLGKISASCLPFPISTSYLPEMLLVDDVETHFSCCFSEIFGVNRLTSKLLQTTLSIEYLHTCEGRALLT